MKMSHGSKEHGVKYLTEFFIAPAYRNPVFFADCDPQAFLHASGVAVLRVNKVVCPVPTNNGVPVTSRHQALFPHECKDCD